MQDLSITVLSIVLVLLQPLYAFNGAWRLGQMGLALLGVVGCLGGLVMVLYCLFRAEESAPGYAQGIHRRTMAGEG